MAPWYQDAAFYHIYPLGLCDAPARNDWNAPVQPRLRRAFAWLDHARDLGFGAVLLGPVFESSSHGYDMADYFKVDRRLGDDALLAELVRHAHGLGLRVALDAVFGHTGRDFWAFKDLGARLQASACRDWYRGVDFARRSPLGDAFGYECWRDAQELPRLRQNHAGVKAHLLEAVTHWVRAFDIDGLRLDTADCLDLEFMTALRRHTDGLKPDFWLMGEMIHGDYNLLANPNRLHSATNYEAYKGLWSSHKDRNYFEIAYALDRQFGATGLYRGLPLYNFADNHDVDRVASKVAGRGQLFPLHCLMFTMPGVPSVYYGGEWGVEARRTAADDRMLRPALDLNAQRRGPQDLADAIRRLTALRAGSAALRGGGYRQLYVGPEALVFERMLGGDRVVVAVNGGAAPLPLAERLGAEGRAPWVDLLNSAAAAPADRMEVPPTWARVLRRA